MENPQFWQNIENLNDLGNVSGKLPERRVIPHSCIDLPGLILKQYIMEERGKIAPITKDLTDIWNLLLDEIKGGNLKPLSGMGFSIVSSGILNVCRWDMEYIDVIVPKIYTLEKGLWTPQEVETVGAFCSGEKRVYDHENKAWLKYLDSRRINQDKADYLNDFIKQDN